MEIKSKVITNVYPKKKNGLVVLTFGIEITYPGKVVGPYVRDRYVLLYVIAGRGVFNDVRIGRGNGFIVRPNQKHYYCSDLDDPLVYCWLTFNGDSGDDIIENLGLSPCGSPFEYEFSDMLERIVPSLVSHEPTKASINEYLYGCFMMITSHHLEEMSGAGDVEKRDVQKEYVENAIKYIKSKYHHSTLRVSEIANFVGLERHYLSALFVSKMGISPKEYLITTRIDKAKQLLADDTLSIQEVARSVGYVDPLYFSRIFKKYVGVSPMAFRKELS